jgi:chromosome transmission fidelity protein 4
MSIGNGPIGIDGHTTLRYTVENVKRDEICQNEDTVALPEGASLQSVFFSDNGVSAIHTEELDMELTAFLGSLYL